MTSSFAKINILPLLSQSDSHKHIQSQTTGALAGRPVNKKTDSRLESIGKAALYTFGALATAGAAYYAWNHYFGGQLPDATIKDAVPHDNNDKSSEIVTRYLNASTLPAYCDNCLTILYNIGVRVKESNTPVNTLPGFQKPPFAAQATTQGTVEILNTTVFNGSEHSCAIDANPLLGNPPMTAASNPWSVYYIGLTILGAIGLSIVGNHLLKMPVKTSRKASSPPPSSPTYSPGGFSTPSPQPSHSTSLSSQSSSAKSQPSGLTDSPRKAFDFQTPHRPIFPREYTHKKQQRNKRFPDVTPTALHSNINYNFDLTEATPQKYLLRYTTEEQKLRYRLHQIDILTSLYKKYKIPTPAIEQYRRQIHDNRENVLGKLSQMKAAPSDQNYEQYDSTDTTIQRDMEFLDKMIDLHPKSRLYEFASLLYGQLRAKSSLVCSVPHPSPPTPRPIPPETLLLISGSGFK